MTENNTNARETPRNMTFARLDMKLLLEIPVDIELCSGFRLRVPAPLAARRLSCNRCPHYTGLGSRIPHRHWMQLHPLPFHILGQSLVLGCWSLARTEAA